MIVVHHLERSRSQRVLWLLEELGLDYEIRVYPRDPKTMRAPAALRAVHPLGKSPVVVDGDKTLAESGAILETLLDAYGAGRLVPPQGSPDRLRYVYFLHYAEGSLMPSLTMRLVFMRLPRPRPFSSARSPARSPPGRSPPLSIRKSSATSISSRASWRTARGSPARPFRRPTFR